MASELDVEGENVNAARAHTPYEDVYNSSGGPLWLALYQKAVDVRHKILNHIRPSMLMAVRTSASSSSKLQPVIINANTVGASCFLNTGNTITTYTQGTANTGNGASAAIVAANTSRKYLLLINDSDTTVYLGLGIAAENGKGVRLNANGGSYEMSAAAGNLTTGAINGYASAAKAVCYTEGV